jgi:DNA-binding MarR family transcriptional regulator
MQQLATELADLDLIPSEINVLANLADDRPRTVSELGAAVGSRPTTLTGVLDRLELRREIKRVPSATDRRAVVVELTATGRQTATRISVTMAAIGRRALRPLPTNAITGCQSVLAALTEVRA